VCDGALEHVRRRSKCKTCDSAPDASDSQRRSGRDRDYLSALAILRCFVARVLTGARPAAFCRTAPATTTTRTAAAATATRTATSIRLQVCDACVCLLFSTHFACVFDVCHCII